MKNPVISHNFRLFKSYLNCTAKDLADKLGAGKSAIESYCDGRATPRFDVVNRAANLFSVKPEQILNQKLTESDLKNTGRTRTIAEVELEAVKRERDLLLQTVNDLRFTIELLKLPK